MKRVKWTIGLSLALFVVVGLAVPLPISPPSDTRMIVDHTNRVYVAPPCFNEAELTNYLEETTYEGALQTDYEPESDCTSRALESESVPLVVQLFGGGSPSWKEW